MRMRGKNKRRAVCCLFLLGIMYFQCISIQSYAEEKTVSSDRGKYFTKSEVEYIDNLKEITIGYFPDKVPLSFTNEKTGEFCGITRYIFDEVQRMTGLKFRYVELPTDGVPYEFVKENHIQFISNVEKKSAETMDFDQSKIQLTRPYLTAKEVFVARSDFKFLQKYNYRVAVSSGSTSILQVLKTLYPEYRIQKYNSIQDCFNAVKQGEVDVLMQNQYIADYYLQMPTSEDMQVLPIDGYIDELCLAEIVGYEDVWTGSLEGQEEEVFSIVNKGISIMKKDQIEAIIAKATMENKYKLQTKDVLYKYKTVLLLTGSAVIIILLFMTYVILSKRKMANQLRKQLAMQKKLMLEQKKYSFLVEKTQNPVFELNCQTGQIIISDKMQQKFGWTLSEDKNWLSSEQFSEKWKIHPEDKAILDEAIHQTYREKKDTECLIRIANTEGTYFWTKVSRYPLLDAEGELLSVVGQIIDVDEDVREKEHLQRLCQIDGLTQLLNKKAFTTEAKKYFKENTGRAALIFVDLDHFKSVNDNLGHLRGDQVIRDAARKLQLMFANVDLVARFGGDEFCLLIKNIPEYKLKSKLEWAVFHMRQVYEEGDIQVEVTTSIGAYFWKNGEVTLEHMMEMADKALYEAKENGRDQFVLHEQKMNEKIG